MKRIIHWLLPKDKKLPQLISLQSENVMEGAKELKDFIINYPKLERAERKSRSNSINLLKDKGSKLRLEIISHIDRSLASYSYRADITCIVNLIDNALNLIDAVAIRLVIMGIERIDDHINKLVGMAFDAVRFSCNILSSLISSKFAQEDYAKICSLNKETGETFNNALSELFHFYKNSIDLIKYKELYGLLRETVECCNELAELSKRIFSRH